MNERPSLSRRRLAAFLAALPTLLLSRQATRAGPRDQGIGGTGRAQDPEEPLRDRGIGGTGVVGTIRGFGSIIVNGLRISYPSKVRVTIDGEAARASDLKIGHVVRTKAERRGRHLSTRAIMVDNEVVGTIESVGPESFVVLKQVVFPPEPMTWQLGETVAVSGLRRSDGAIVASLVESRAKAQVQVVGPLTLGRDGAPEIAGLRLVNLDPALIGNRCVVRGQESPEGLVVANASEERFLLLADRPRRLLVEAYVREQSDRVVLGSGLEVTRTPALAPEPPAGEYRAVLSLAVTRAGELAVTGVRTEGPGAGRNGPGRDAGRADRFGGPQDARFGTAPPGGPANPGRSQPGAGPGSGFGGIGSPGDGPAGPGGGPGSHPGPGPGGSRSGPGGPGG